MAENIPLDIILDNILPQLPAKSLLHFKTVSKQWLSLISTHKFIHDHLHHTQSSNTNNLLIFTANNSSLYSYNPDFPENPVFKLPDFGFEPFVVGSSNGLLCIRSQKPYYLALVNPSTGSYRKISSLVHPRRIVALNYGFGYDILNDDYKIVRIVDRYPCIGFLGREIDRIVHVYSLRANSWELIEWGNPGNSMGFRENGVLIKNHLLHWKFWCLNENRYRICSFDLNENNWSHDVPLPDYSDHDNGDRDGVLDFGVLNGSLYLSTRSNQQSGVDIWVMKEYCVKDSWVKMFRISDSRVLGSLRLSPVVFDSLKRKLLVRSVNKTERNNWWYNIENETLDNADFNGVQDCVWVDVCKGSLVNVPGGSQLGKTNMKDE